MNNTHKREDSLLRRTPTWRLSWATRDAQEVEGSEERLVRLRLLSVAATVRRAPAALVIAIVIYDSRWRAFHNLGKVRHVASHTSEVYS